MSTKFSILSGDKGGRLLILVCPSKSSDLQNRSTWFLVKGVVTFTGKQPHGKRME